jgi:hypothetical protein
MAFALTGGHLMDRPTLRLEIPLPRWLVSPRLRFSLRTLIVVVALIAAGLAIYTRGREAERKYHTGGYFQLVVSADHSMESGTLRCEDFPSVLALAQSHEISVRQLPFESETDPKVMWPPKIWMTRVDWDGDVSEETINVECGGTPDDPKIDPSISINIGDCVVFDYGKRSKSEPTDETKTGDMDRTIARAD